MSSVPAPEENDMTREKMMELEPLLEASGERNLRSIEKINMGNAHAIAWHRQCGTRSIQTFV